MPFEHVVIVLPGISGSVLAKDGQEIWGTSSDAIWRAVTSGGASIKSLALTAPDDPTLDDLGDGVTATKLVPDMHIIPGLWKIDGYTALVARLRTDLDLQPGANLFEFPYDWRRDNRVSARKLARFAGDKLSNWRQQSGNAKAKLVLVVHSMGGLVSRYFLECLGGWKDTRALVSFGTPYRGSLNALGYLVNGYSKGIGPLQVDLTDTLKSFTAVYQLLPAYECVDRGSGKLERVGEVEGLPGVDAARAKAALDFYREIGKAQENNAKTDDYARLKYDIFPIVGLAQPTFQSALLNNGRVELLKEIDKRDLSGDGTVPRLSATPVELSDAHREIYVAETHGSLQNFDPALVNLIGALTGTTIDLGHYRFVAQTVSVDLDDVYAAEAVEIRATPSIDAPVAAKIFQASSNALVLDLPLQPADEGRYIGRASLPPGAYRATVTAQFRDGPVSATDLFLVVAGT